jgi:hypothetical protein
MPTICDLDTVTIGDNGKYSGSAVEATGWAHPLPHTTQQKTNDNIIVTNSILIYTGNPHWFLEGNVFMPEPTVIAPQDDKKPAGVISFEEAAHHFTGEPFRRSKVEVFILGTVCPGSYTAITSTDYGRIEEGPRKILTPIPITRGEEKAKVIIYNFSTTQTTELFKEAIISKPVVWTKYIYYQEKEREIRNLTKDFPSRIGEDKPHIPAYYEKQIPWYRQQQEHYYNMLFEPASPENTDTGSVSKG